MFVKVEPTGCCERKGLAQVRFCMYLEPDDYGYEIHHVQIPVIPEGGYTGECNEMGIPKDMGAYHTWLGGLPKVWRDNPFHNHFIYVEPDTTDEVIMDIGEAFMEEAYIKWASDEKRDLKNPPVEFPISFDKGKIEVKVQHLKETILERRL